jgi:hypothetical protein
MDCNIQASGPLGAEIVKADVAEDCRSIIGFYDDLAGMSTGKLNFFLAGIWCEL